MANITQERSRIDNTLREQLIYLNEAQKESLRTMCISVIDQSSTGINRSTAYNTKEEQQALMNAAHRELLEYSRTIYMLMYSLPSTYYMKQLGVMNLLTSTPDGVIPAHKEQAILNMWLRSMPVPAVLRMFCGLVDKRVNNSRTKRVMLHYILSDSLEFWSVKYRSKLRKILKHCLGFKMFKALKYISALEVHTPKQQYIIHSYINKYIVDDVSISKSEILECICFILGGNKAAWSMPMFKAFFDARVDSTKLSKLPLEIAEGIRAMYHPTMSKDSVVELTKSNLSAKQAIKVSTQSRAKDVVIEKNFNSYSSKELYLYCFANGVKPASGGIRTQEAKDICKVLAKNAEKAAKAASITNRGLKGILLDCSNSMKGSGETSMHPMASALSVRDMLTVNSEALTYTTDDSDVDFSAIGYIPSVGSDTNLARGIVALLERGCKDIYIVTDGYENAPAGRVHELLSIIRKGQIEDVSPSLPVTQITTVLSADAKGSKVLSPHVINIPVKNLDTIKTATLRQSFEHSLESGLSALVSQSNLLD